MPTKGNKEDMRVLKEFKEEYQLTWPQVAESLGRSERAIETWYVNKKLPQHFKVLIQIFTEYPDIYKRFKMK